MPLGTPTRPTPMVAVNSGNDVTTAPFTPSANALLFVGLSARVTATLVASTIADSLGLSWTLLTDVSYDNLSGTRVRQRVYCTAIGASPASMTVTHNNANVSARLATHTMQITGTVAIPTNKASNPNANGDPPTTLDPAPDPASTLLGFFGGAITVDTPISPPTGFTELEDAFLTDGSLQMQTSYKIGSGAATNNWSTTLQASCGSIIEVRSPVASRAFARWY